MEPIDILLSGDDTGGHLAVVEMTIVAGAEGPPLHVHPGHGEGFYVLAGEVTIRAGEEITTASAGSFACAPAGVPHTFANWTERDARLLVLCTGAGSTALTRWSSPRARTRALSPGNAVSLENGSWANLDLDFVRVRERIYDVAGSLYWAVESGADLDRPLLLEAYDRTAPEPLTADETRLLPTALTWIPLHWVATAGFIGGVPEAERALATAEAWWSRQEDLSWYPERPSQVTG